MDDKEFKILSIDGGGVKGIFAVKILSLIERELGIKTYDTFDLIVGTSTGSIIAGAVATKYDLTQLVDDYSDLAFKIFKRRWSSFGGFVRSKYSSKPLEAFVRQKFGDIKLRQIEKPLIINATNASAGDVHVFKTIYQKTQRSGDYIRDGEVPLFKAILASCAAPTYFDPVDVNGDLICDGGIWANNPSLVGYTDAVNNFKPTNIKILSLGTGKSKQMYKKSKNWGALFGWKKTKLVDFFMSCQTTFPENVLDLINGDKTLRINPEVEDCKLDEYKCIPNLKKLAKDEFKYHREKLDMFLTTKENIKWNTNKNLKDFYLIT